MVKTCQAFTVRMLATRVQHQLSLPVQQLSNVDAWRYDLQAQASAAPLPENVANPSENAGTLHWSAALPVVRTLSMLGKSPFGPNFNGTSRPFKHGAVAFKSPPGAVSTHASRAAIPAPTRIVAGCPPGCAYITTNEVCLQYVYTSGLAAELLEELRTSDVEESTRA